MPLGDAELSFGGHHLHARPAWDQAAEMILVAAENPNREDVAEATRQAMVALEKRIGGGGRAAPPRLHVPEPNPAFQGCIMAR